MSTSSASGGTPSARRWPCSGGHGRAGPAPAAAGWAADGSVVLAPIHRDIDVALITCSVDGETAPRGAVDFRALAWRPSRNGDGPGWVVPPLVEMIDYLEEESFSAVHTDSAAGQGLIALVAARLLHLPVTGAVDPRQLEAPPRLGDVAGRLRRRYLTWFYSRLDEAFVPDRAAARTLVAAGVEAEKITVLPPVSEGGRAGRAGRA